MSKHNEDRISILRLLEEWRQISERDLSHSNGHVFVSQPEVSAPEEWRLVRHVYHSDGYCCFPNAMFTFRNQNCIISTLRRVISYLLIFCFHSA